MDLESSMEMEMDTEQESFSSSLPNSARALRGLSAEPSFQLWLRLAPLAVEDPLDAALFLAPGELLEDDRLPRLVLAWWTHGAPARDKKRLGDLLAPPRLELLDARLAHYLESGAWRDQLDALLELAGASLLHPPSEAAERAAGPGVEEAPGDMPPSSLRALLPRAFRAAERAATDPRLDHAFRAAADFLSPGDRVTGLLRVASRRAGLPPPWAGLVEESLAQGDGALLASRLGPPDLAVVDRLLAEHVRRRRGLA